MTEWEDITNKLSLVTWDEIKEFYQRNFGETLLEDWKEAMCFAWSQSRSMGVIDLLAMGYKARQLHEKQEFANSYSHGSEVQKIAAEYVKKRGTADNLALYEENRFIDGYTFALKQLELTK